jgi:exodeoxyribonuclease III
VDPFTIATWNVNSVRARLERVLRWLDVRKPDVVCLQELKVDEGSFPFEELRSAGYHAAVFGQKTYNGVAILSRAEAEEVERGLGDDVADPQARLVSARSRGVRVLSAYFPNGQAVGSDRYRYKLQWMKRLRRHLDRRHSPQELLVLCGDYNVAPEPRDVYDPAAWEGTVLFHPEVRGALEEVRGFGLVDVFRLHHQEAGLYSWWDYRMLAFPKRRGLRIDHLFATEPLARRCREALIDRDERKGKQPSDHAPVLARFDLS